MTSRDHRLMILGGGHTVLPLIEAARSMGVHVVDVSPTGPYVGLPLADTHVACDVTDASGVLAAARDLAIDGITTTGTDIAVPTIGRVVDTLDLPGTGFEAATCCSDKWFMKQRLASEGDPVANGRLTTRDDAKALACELGLPVFIKAVDSSGSRGVTRVNDEFEVDATWVEAPHASLSGRVIVEQCNDGLEFGAQVAIEGDRATSAFLRNDQLSPPPLFAPLGHSMPCSLPPGLTTVADRVCRAAVEALGVRDSVANVDLIAAGNQVYVLEVRARMGAPCLPENLSAYTAANLYDRVIETALGSSPAFGVEPHRHGAANILLQAPAGGWLSGVKLPVSDLQSEQVYDWRIDKVLGDQVSRFSTGPDRIGHAVTVEHTGDETIEDAQRLAEEFRFRVESATDDSSNWMRQPTQKPAVVLRGGQWLRHDSLRVA